MLYSGRYATSAYGGDRIFTIFIIGFIRGINTDANTGVGIRRTVPMGKNTDTNIGMGTRKI